jgi:Predicted membrane protein (DUF2207) N-terminal domain
MLITNPAPDYEMVLAQREYISRMHRPSRSFLVAATVCLTILFATAADAKSYSAGRFDSVVRMLPGGTLDVTETVVFRFEDGTFREVFREIPLRRTDGIEVVRAEIQGTRLPFGNATGTVEVRRRSDDVRIVWRFGRRRKPRVRPELHRPRRGAPGKRRPARLARNTGEHAYPIDTSTIRFELPAVPSSSPAFIVASTITRLSNDGVRRAAGWRAYRKHLTAVGQGKRDSAGIAVAALLPAAVALGLADIWSKFLKRRATVCLHGFVHYPAMPTAPCLPSSQRAAPV